MDIYETMLGIALRSSRYIDDEWFQTNPRDRYGLWHRPLAGREDIHARTGIDLQDATRLPHNRFNAMKALVAYHNGHWGGLPPAPGDLWRLACIASGYGDPTGRPEPEPLPETGLDTTEWGKVIDWDDLPPESGPYGRAYDPAAALRKASAASR